MLKFGFDGAIFYLSLKHLIGGGRPAIVFGITLLRPGKMDGREAMNRIPAKLTQSNESHDQQQECRQPLTIESAEINLIIVEGAARNSEWLQQIDGPKS